MTKLTSLHSLLMEAFEDLQAHDEANVLREFVQSPSPSSDASGDGAIVVIRTNQATNWLLLALVRARGRNSGHTLLVTSDRRALLLGHAMLASCLPKQGHGQEQLTHSHYMSIAGICNSFQESPLSILVRNKHQGRTSFIRLVRQHIHNTSAKILLVDEPKRCFRKQPKDSRVLSDAIPPSIRRMASTSRTQIIVLERVPSTSLSPNQPGKPGFTP